MGYRALYLHIPFCRSKCLYCDFDSSACGSSHDALDRYVNRLIDRVRACGADSELSEIETVYIGGGTPSLAGDGLVELVRAVRTYCDPHEFTCEANPESFTDLLSRRLFQAGVSRASIGVQSLVPDELAAIGRIHGPGQALAAIAAGKRAGMSVSCDLMCGLPGQTVESWRSTLERILAAPEAPDHFSVYPLQLEEGTPLEALERSGCVTVPDEDFQAACMEIASDILSSAGYRRYEVASYALPGHRCRHNIAYWTGVSYLGLGRSAAGMLDLGAEGRIRMRQLDDEGSRFEREELTCREALAEDLMLACRMVDGIPPALLGRAARTLPAPALRDAVDRAVSSGLARWEGGSLVPTRRGWLEGNELFGLFWDLA